MSAFKIECPHCSQRIECDERYCGVQIKCPACKGDMMIPHLQSASVPIVAPAPEIAPPPPNALTRAPATATAATAASAAPQLAIRVGSAPSPQPAATPPPSSPRPVPMPRAMATPSLTDDEGPGMSKGKKIALIAALVIVVPVAGYFLFSFAGGMQKKFNEAQAKDDDPGVIGGQVGHIGELYNVLDATDPDKMGRNASGESGRGMAGKARKARSVAVNAGGTGAGMETDPVSAIESLPATPAVWTLDVNAAKIPDGRVAGSLARSNFVANRTVLLTGSATPVLAFQQGNFFSSDHELLLFIRLKPGEKLEGKTLTISKDQTADVPQVMKRWKTNPSNPSLPMQQKPFTGGYVMKLEFGKMSPDGLPGKIYVALPDTEQSAIGGSFVATVRVANTAQGKKGPMGEPAMFGDE